jgi:hypothetical protein
MKQSAAENVTIGNAQLNFAIPEEIAVPISGAIRLHKMSVLY